MINVFRRFKQGEAAMTNQNRAASGPARRSRSMALMLCCALLGTLGTPSAATAARAFPSPEKAAAALAAAWHGGHPTEILKIFGPGGDKLVRSGDPVGERKAWARLASSYDQSHRIDIGGNGTATLVIGDDEWPYPIPLVRKRAGWQFDVKSGAEEILDRRIGRNELNAIKVCRAYVEAQQSYAARNPLGSGLHEYARKVASTGGRHDGLYWPAAPGGTESPLGPFVAAAEAQGYSDASAEGRAPFHGYYYRILTRQGEQAPGGAQNYVVDGHMTGGFALVAFPAKYGSSGVMTFVVNQHGIIFEKNLGPDTANMARRMTAYDPDRSWKIVAP
jgi:hypothetical protein